MTRNESPSSELSENVLSSQPKARILSFDQAPQVIRFECFPKIGVRLKKLLSFNQSKCKLCDKKIKSNFTWWFDDYK